MTTLNDFKQLRASVPAETQGELYLLFTSDPEASFQRMVELAAEKGVTLTVDEVKGFLKQMDEDDEFDDIELDAIALKAIAGGYGNRRVCCQREAHDEPCGRCPGMRPMRKWLFGVGPELKTRSSVSKIVRGHHHIISASSQVKINLLTNT